MQLPRDANTTLSPPHVSPKGGGAKFCCDKRSNKATDTKGEGGVQYKHMMTSDNHVETNS